MDNSIECEDPTTICYQVLVPGGRLIGKIECSDAFGVDLLLENFINNTIRNNSFNNTEMQMNQEEM